MSDSHDNLGAPLLAELPPLDPPSEGPAGEPAEAPAGPTPEALLAEREAQLLELTEQVKRVSAEFENFRRRQQEEAKRRLVLMKEDLFRTLLPIVDNFDRSIEAARQTSSVESLLKGVELIRREFQKVFDNHEITVIPAQGERFDPSLHEAMMVEDREDIPDQTIVLELQKGYKLGERVLRPSMVKVAQNSGSGSPQA